MNVLLVGNGFDLHHKFPTNYIDFLHVVQFLKENYNESMTTIDHILGDSQLQQRNSFIAECYNKHSHIYNSTNLPNNLIHSIISRSKTNMWFKYLCGCVSKDIRWIDFEKEILRVLTAFDSLFDDSGELLLEEDHIFLELPFPSLDAEKSCILSQFNFFYEGLDESEEMMCIKKEFVTEEVIGSGTYYLSKDDIVSTLYKSLRELADILRDYLKVFVDNPAIEYAQSIIRPRFASLPTSYLVYSFNYTNTFEILYRNDMVDHIHGTTNGNIVLGINPDEKDELEDIDTTFLQFKKYFQRVFFKTDTSFLKQMTSHKQTPPAISDRTVIVIGHSLDSTDKDVIQQIFNSAKAIVVLYHNELSVKNQIKNLVEMYGKEGFDQLREKKDLQFLPQSEIQWE